jgi:hypothetical protein
MSGTTAITSHAVHIEALTKHAPELCVIVNVARIEVIPDSAFEKSRILRDNCESTPQIQQPYRRSVQRINANIAFTWFDDPKKGKGK